MTSFCILNTVEPRFNEPLCNEVLDITNDTLRPGQNYSKMYGIQPRYNEPQYNEFLDITNIIQKPKCKIIVITAEHPSHGVKGAFWMFPSPYNINLLIIYLFTYSYVIYLCNLWSKLNKLKIKIYLDITNNIVNTRQKINAEQINSQQIL